jgi:DNA-binding MarR family transcriptional regulator
MNTRKTTPPSKATDALVVDNAAADTVNLDRYAPAYLTWIANKLSRGASQHYLNIFDVGIETWRCLVLLAIDGSISAQKVSRIVGMDKGSVSRCFKSMQEKGLIRTELDESDGRFRIAVLTPKGRALHDQIKGVAMERERAFLSVLSKKEVDVLLGLLRRLHENLPAVETATQEYIQVHFPQAGARRRPPSDD